MRIGGKHFKRMEDQGLPNCIVQCIMVAQWVVAGRLETLNGGMFKGIRSAILERKFQTKKCWWFFYLNMARSITRKIIRALCRLAEGSCVINDRC
ncbi:hypothetical protein A3860_25195 [Niastella vici]|uniref:Uncharacterized protein n=1 Tax=Niastella vici TaxID=1703345 RepID=A0A1V9FXU5_9BACT|nr:hypothetical protein A3860_25195 [Niastella vici]